MEQERASATRGKVIELHPSQGGRVLVTGGTGFVAGWCIALLLERGFAVRASVRRSEGEALVRTALAKIPGAQQDWQERLDFAEADLASEAGWDAAVRGCTHVLHLAYPKAQDIENQGPDLINQAVGGAIRVLRASMNARVKRVVMTSSLMAAMPDGAPVSTEHVWTDPEKPGMDDYSLSKLYAERGAWDFMAEEVRRGGSKMEFVTLLPGTILGPVLHLDMVEAVGLIQRILQGKPRVLPELRLQIADVRDLAEAHIAAMLSPQADGQRFIIAGEAVSLPEIAQHLRERLGDKARKVPAGAYPDMIVKLASGFDSELRQLVASHSGLPVFSSARATERLDYRPRPIAETVVDCANSLFANNAA